MSNDTAEVHRLVGVPGAGKTTTLFDRVEEERGDGLPLTDLYYMTFARSGVEESEDRLSDKYPDADKDDVDKRAKTFHGVACTTCYDAGILQHDTDQVIQRGKHDDVYQRFAERHGLEYDPYAGDPLSPGHDGSTVDPLANRLFITSDYLSLLVRGPKWYRHAPVDLPWSGEQTVTLLKAWDAYKKAGRPDEGLPLFEHNDYVRRALDDGLVPDAKVLFIDEFQDLAPLEYALYKMWRDSGEIDRIYIAGDPNQSIYSFRAGRPDYFAGTDVDGETRLTDSYRCSSSVADAAGRLLDDSPDPSASGDALHGRTDGGTASRMHVDTDAALAAAVRNAVAEHGGTATAGTDGTDADPSVFLLTRANYQAQGVASALRDEGIPFNWLGRRTSAWNDGTVRALNTLRDIRRGEPALAVGVREVFNAAPGDRLGRMAAREGEDTAAASWNTIDLHGSAISPEQFWRAFPEASTVADVVALLDIEPWRKKRLRAALDAEGEIAPGQVRVGTIHSAKGLEAPAVFLFDAYTPRLLREYRQDRATTEEEHRLYYVGATRASETLRIVSGFFDGDTFPGLDNLGPLKETPRAADDGGVRR